MTAVESLYLEFNTEEHKESKIDLLQSKSSVLLARNRIKQIENLEATEVQLILKIKKLLSQFNALMKKLKTEIPSMKISAEAEEENFKNAKLGISQHKRMTDIEKELFEINNKLEELLSS